MRGGRQVLRSALHNAVGKANVADVQLCVARGECDVGAGLHSSHPSAPSLAAPAPPRYATHTAARGLSLEAALPRQSHAHRAPRQCAHLQRHRRMEQPAAVPSRNNQSSVPTQTLSVLSVVRVVYFRWRWLL